VNDFFEGSSKHDQWMVWGGGFEASRGFIAQKKSSVLRRREMKDGDGEGESRAPKMVVNEGMMAGKKKSEVCEKKK